MQILMISLCMITLTVQSVFKRIYNGKVQGGEFLFSMGSALAACIFFFCISFGSQFRMEIVPYALVFAVCYAVSSVSSIMALRYGLISITVLVLSYSLVIPTLAGIVLWKEEIGWRQGIGILLILGSLYLINMKKEKEKDKVSLKWLLLVVTGCMTDGFCSVIQKQQQLVFQGKYDKSFMAVALSVVVLFLGIAVQVKERRQALPNIRQAGWLPAVSGVCNGLTNLLVMLCVAIMPATLFFPVLSVGQLLLILLVSVVGFRERLQKKQLVGFAIGIIAMILMNL